MGFHAHWVVSTSSFIFVGKKEHLLVYCTWKTVEMPTVTPAIYVLEAKICVTKAIRNMLWGLIHRSVLRLSPSTAVVVWINIHRE